MSVYWVARSEHHLSIRRCEITIFFAPMVTDCLDKKISVVHWYWALNKILKIFIETFFFIIRIWFSPQCQCTTEKSLPEWSVTIGARTAAISLALAAATSVFRIALRWYSLWHRCHTYFPNSFSDSFSGPLFFRFKIIQVEIYNRRGTKQY